MPIGAYIKCGSIERYAGGVRLERRVRGLLSIAWGSTRIVILVWKWAIKVPSFVEWRLFLLGLLANMQESKFSKTGWAELCPVVFSLYGGFLIVMLRADPLSRDQFNEIDFDKWVDRGDYRIPVENKLDSFGFLENKLVAVDYGN